MSDIIARAEAALEGVTEGPWQWESDTRTGGETEYWLPEIQQWRGYRNNIQCGTDKALARFIAAARTLVPELVAELKTARAQLEADSAELTAYRRDDYDSHMFGHFQDQSDVRCYGCDLRYGEREDYCCGDDGQPGAPGGAHDYDEAELAAAATCNDRIHQYANQFDPAAAEAEKVTGG